jgi:hypothetical protein
MAAVTVYVKERRHFEFLILYPGKRICEEVFEHVTVIGHQYYVILVTNVTASEVLIPCG